ncbi:hypothetical protein [Mycoplasma sp. HS2188]|uniref:hypothetical protein n=1 Tax=Mycoplasma sp. HS2188 TaxID=2976765 RepID=UPI0021AA7503|nr:hypothetical protein [Mycoplasma sp. HS2188]MCT4469988.1 hypothetical protein [Mycoplasma sp. HS2188]
MGQTKNNKVGLVKSGSRIAKNGFKLEKEVAQKFCNWTIDADAKKWLEQMGYNINHIEFVNATTLNGFKADLKVDIKIKLKNQIKTENIQVKLVSNTKGFNQVDKRRLKSYKKMWDIPDYVYRIFAHYTGELSPYLQNSIDKRRMFVNEFNQQEQEIFLNWLNINKLKIINDILKGDGVNITDWFLVIQKFANINNSLIKNIDDVINYYLDNGNIQVTKRGTIKIGKITMQRKGGDSGRDSAKMLQFKWMRKKLVCKKAATYLQLFWF